MPATEILLPVRDYDLAATLDSGQVFRWRHVGDSWHVNRQLTLNLGLRYENFRPPYEANGLQVDTTVPLNQYFAQRNGLQQQGVPANQMSDFTLSYALNGPVNGKQSWWAPNNRQPPPWARISVTTASPWIVMSKRWASSLSR